MHTGSYMYGFIKKDILRVNILELPYYDGCYCYGSLFTHTYYRQLCILSPGNLYSHPFPSLHSESGHVERGKMHGGSKRIGRVRKSGRERVRKRERRRKEKRNVSIRVCFESFDKGLNSK